jgi:hypothetical protein
LEIVIANKRKLWSEEEKKKFNAIVEKYGRDKGRLRAAFPDKEIE